MEINTVQRCIDLHLRNVLIALAVCAHAGFWNSVFLISTVPLQFLFYFEGIECIGIYERRYSVQYNRQNLHVKKVYKNLPLRLLSYMRD